METELKLVLDSAESLRSLVRRAGAELPVCEQSNEYFDGAGWKDARLAVRLRREVCDGSAIHQLTVKSEGTALGDFSCRGEWQRELPEEEVARLRRDPRALTEVALALLPPDLRGEEGLGELHPVASVVNERRRIRFEAERGWILELDTTVYPDGSTVHEAELEVEGPEEAEAAARALRAFFAVAGVEWQPSQVSKRERLQRILDRSS